MSIEFVYIQFRGAEFNGDVSFWIFVGQIEVEPIKSPRIQFSGQSQNPAFQCFWPIKTLKIAQISKLKDTFRRKISRGIRWWCLFCSTKPRNTIFQHFFKFHKNFQKNFWPKYRIFRQFLADFLDYFLFSQSRKFYWLTVKYVNDA